MANPQYNKMMKQVQEMQRKMAQAQEELAVETVEASAGGGMVTVVVTGALEVKEVRIKPGGRRPRRRRDAAGPRRGGHQRGAARRPGPGVQPSSAAPPAASTCPTSPACSRRAGAARLRRRAGAGLRHPARWRAVRSSGYNQVSRPRRSATPDES